MAKSPAFEYRHWTEFHVFLNTHTRALHTHLVGLVVQQGLRLRHFQFDGFDVLGWSVCADANKLSMLQVSFSNHSTTQLHDAKNNWEDK